VHGEFFTHLMYGSEGISMFQFHPDFDRLHYSVDCVWTRGRERPRERNSKDHPRGGKTRFSGRVRVQ